ncbi:MAG: DUF4417 domain-containing protein [Prevotella sp.]|nr:DUF4417 domain-containing protein [Prevotella sp.]
MKNKFIKRKDEERVVSLSFLSNEIAESRPASKSKCRESVKRKKRTALGADLYSDIETTGVNDIPVVKACNVEPPQRILPYNVWREERDMDAAVCFYIDDYRFASLRQDPMTVIEKIKNAPFVIAPDFSQTTDMPAWQRMNNSCLNKAYAAYFQRNGLNVIPNVSWSLPDSYEYCFEGLPKHSIICINSMGANASSTSRYLWRKGYEQALKVLQPTFILRYGAVMPGEHTEISKYYDNPFISRMRYGS